ncbi:uncharacterized protein LOC136079397 [Hydra vulgaris]|uniref:Uncharacterized protein LOC136079397 n=1 Tax=Hydra vulgaris TaxID=6087 RepID=A0ABM4BQ05_HYDVU
MTDEDYKFYKDSNTKNIFYKFIDNSYLAHAENTLIEMLVNEDEEVGRKAVDKILHLKGLLNVFHGKEDSFVEGIVESNNYNEVNVSESGYPSMNEDNPRLILKLLKHIEACQVYDHWKQNRILNEDTETLIRHKASFWKMVLERLFNITLMLTKNLLEFRGYSEVLADEIYNGNFFSYVYLLSKYDGTMKKLLNKPKGTIKYLSPAIQNEEIRCLSQNLENTLLLEIDKSAFFSIIVDTTQDVSKKEQLSLIF